MADGEIKSVNSGASCGTAAVDIVGIGSGAWCRNLLVVLAAIGALAAPWACAADRWADIRHHDGFAGWNDELQRMVRRTGHQRDNHFCIVVHDDTSSVEAYVYWREENLLLTWGPSSDPVSTLNEIGAPLDLNRDVVSTRKQIGSSTFLVTESWVENVLGECGRFGTSIEISKG